jgi:thioredoxin
MAVEITDDNFSTIIDGEKPIVIDFGAEWCGPCKTVAPIIEELANEYKEQVTIGKCDVDASPDLAARYSIRNIPTILFIKNGEVVDKLVGAVPKAKIEEKVKGLL